MQIKTQKKSGKSRAKGKVTLPANSIETYDNCVQKYSADRGDHGFFRSKKKGALEKVMTFFMTHRIMSELSRGD